MSVFCGQIVSQEELSCLHEGMFWKVCKKYDLSIRKRPIFQQIAKEFAGSRV